MIDTVRAVSPELTAAWAASARIHFDVGEVDLAAEEVGTVLARWTTAARDWSWPLVLADAAEAVAGLGDREAARTLLDEVSAYSGELGVVGAAIFCVGAYDRYRGMLLDTLGRHDEAVAALEDALALETAADAPVLAARTRYWLAVALRHRAAPGDSDRAGVELSESLATAESLGMAALAAAARQLVD